MPKVALIRLVAVAGVMLTRSLSTSTPVFEAITLSVAFGHYALALYYGRERVLSTLRSPPTAALLLLLGVSALIPVYLGLSVAVWFAAHHVINETYAPKRADGSLLITGARRWLALLLHTLTFACLHKTRTLFTTPTFWALFAAAGAVYVVYVASVIAIRRELSRRELAEHVFGESLALGAVFASFYLPINLLHLAAYHFGFWMLYPALKMRAAARWRYAALTLVVTAGMLLISPLGLPSIAMSRNTIYFPFALLTFVHVHISLVLSALNPVFVTAWVRSLGREASAT